MVYAEPAIDFRVFGGEGGSVALRKATCNNDEPRLARTLEVACAENFVVGFLSCRLNEGAGVHENAVGAIGIGRQRDALCEESAGHYLKIDGVLGAAQADKPHRKLVPFIRHSCRGVGEGCR